uniref:Copia protein n=1 Tax=Tanacetum cinerariifolium TaxID=118510 RepID=A0A6L2MJB4_TANCI|nr:copia protein [Tanacetum cinerariifolium]
MIVSMKLSLSCLVTYGSRGALTTLVKEYQEKDKIGSKPNKNGKREVILGLEYPIEWIGSIKCGKEYLRGSRLVLLWWNGWWRWWRWGQLSLFGICEHGGEIVYGIGLVCHGGGLCGDVSEEEGGQLDAGLDIGGGGSVFGSGVFFRRHGNENESTKRCIQFEKDKDSQEIREGRRLEAIFLMKRSSHPLQAMLSLVREDRIKLALSLFSFLMDKNVIRLLLKEQSDVFTARLIAIQTELKATKGLVQTRHGGGSDQGSAIPQESIDSGFARFNTIITSLKALDEGFSSKNCVRKHEVVTEKDLEIYKGKKERINSIAMKAKKESSDDETLTSRSVDVEYVMAIKNFKKLFRRKGKFAQQPREERKSHQQRDEKKRKSDRKCFRCGDPSHLIGDCPKTSRNKDQKAFIGGSWSDSENDAEDKTNDETFLMAQSSNEVTFNSSCYSDNTSSLDNDNMQIEYDSLCEISLKIMNKSKILKAKRDLLEKEISELNEKIKNLRKAKKLKRRIPNQPRLRCQRRSSSPKTMKPTLWIALNIENPKNTHLEAVNCILRNIRGTSHLGLWNPKGTRIETVVYADSDDAGDYDDRKSTSGVCTLVECCLTSWFTKKQTALSICTTKAEYVSAGKACQQALWMKQALIDYDIRLDNFPIMCNNKGVIDLSKNPVQHSKTKHIEIRHHFLHDNVQKGNISIEKVASKDNIADIFTKILKREVFNYLRLGLGMMELIMDSDPSSSQK